MGIERKISGTNFALAGAPPVIPMNALRFPTRGLAGIFLMNPDSGGNNVTSIPNEVGGDPATIKSGTGWATPVSATFGTVLTSGVTCFDSKLSITGNCTAIVAADCDAVVGDGAGNTAFVGNIGRVGANGNSTHLNGSPAILTSNTAITPVNLRMFLNPPPTGQVSNNDMSGSLATSPFVAGVSYDGDAGVMTLRDHLGNELTIEDADMIDLYPEAAVLANSRWAFGAWPLNTAGVGKSKHFCYAFYSVTQTALEMAYAIAAAKAIAVGRGVVFS